MAQGRLVVHDAAAELDDGDPVAEAANPAEGLDEHVGLLDGLFLGRIGQVTGLPKRGRGPVPGKNAA